MPKLDPNGTFKREKEMIAHFANNLHLLEPDMHLFIEAGGPGTEHHLFETYLGTSPRMDIFAVDRNGGLVIIECKVDHGHPAALGQLAGYVQWAYENYPTCGRPIRAFLVCKKASPMLWYAIKQIPAIPFEVFEYTNKKKVKRLAPPTYPPAPPPKQTGFLL